MNLLQVSILFTLWIAALAVSEGGIYAQNRFTPDEEVSRLWIKGSSNVNTFDCIAHKYDEEATVKDSTNYNSPVQEQDQEVSVEVVFDVESFDCGKRKINNDMKDALKADQYPNIRFVYKKAELDPNLPDNNFIIHGDLTLAGVTREISFIAKKDVSENGEMRVRGNIKIFMTDYGIEPPTGLFGLIKADDELTVHFDLIAKRI
ncbi:YceI family protein [Rhodohalobacter sp.]|uniref:YceI family protein n=1 Tax=Rhodohalobacter sp. TaxID=1974210 RepID=UPI002ACD2C99|nr:YceI family protein [Rhodohalobacter sp.]MDZ7755422.1 YceI family protein [Rhodohalobacter sp.]